MVILIGGSSHVGKTMVAQKLMQKYAIPYISLDHLKMGFIRSHMTSLTVNDDNELTDFMWPFVAELIKTVIENDQNLIIEGCYIPTDWKDSFSNDYQMNIRSVFLVMSEAYLRKHIDDVINYANVIEKRIADEVNLERLIACSRNFKRECSEFNNPIYEIDSKFDYFKILESVAKILNLPETNDSMSE